MRIQENKNSCGAAAIQNALRAIGVNVQERTVRKLCGTNEAGTDEPGMLNGLDKLGYYSEVFETTNVGRAETFLRNYLSGGWPVILAVDEDTHWAVCVGKLGDRYVVVDSERVKRNMKENGCYVLGIRKFLKRWRKPDGTMYGIAIRKRKKHDYMP